jgi:hypothetical protein
MFLMSPITCYLFFGLDIRKKVAKLRKWRFWLQINISEAKPLFKVAEIFLGFFGHTSLLLPFRPALDRL